MALVETPAAFPRALMIATSKKAITINPAPNGTFSAGCELIGYTFRGTRRSATCVTISFVRSNDRRIALATIVSEGFTAPRIRFNF